MPTSRLTLALLLPLLVACSSSGPAGETHEPRRLRVLTYNIHHGEGTDGVVDYRRLADVILSVQPDLVALQEVDVATGRSGGVDQPARLAELTGLHAAFHAMKPYDGGLYGEAVLSRLPLDAGPRGLDTEGLAPEMAMLAIAVVELRPWGDDGPAVTFAGVHLSPYAAEQRLSQIRQINEQLLTDADRLVLIAGDFNFEPGTPGYDAVNARWLDTADALGDAQPTFPSNPPTKRIDYLFAHPADRWRVVETRVLDEPLASDHAPLLVVLELAE